MANKQPHARNTPTHPLVIAGAGLTGAALLFKAPAILSAVFGLSGSRVTPEQERERKRIDFCKSIRESVKSGDKLCGKYLATVDAELAKEKAAAAAADSERRAEAAEAANPNREISSIEMTTCRMILRDAMKDPRSFRVNNETRRGGGLIDYTATNSLGGPVRAVFKCTEGRKISGDG